MLVPERERQAEVLKTVAETGEPVLVPAVGPAAGVVVGEMVPGVAGCAIVFADGAPGPLGEIRAPVLPVSAASRAVFRRRCSAVWSRDTGKTPTGMVRLADGRGVGLRYNDAIIE